MQGIREQVAELRAELDDLKGASAPAAGPMTTSYMGIAPSPAELEFKLIRSVSLHVPDKDSSCCLFSLSF